MTRPDTQSFAANMALFMRRTGNPEADSFWSLIDFDQQCEQAARAEREESFRIPRRSA